MASEFSYKLTQKAETDLDEIIAYTAVQLKNLQAASDFIDKLQSVINEVCAFPESGILVNNEFLPYKNIRKKLVKNYILYYLSDANEKTIYILRVIYGRRNVDEILREMNL